MEIFTSSNPSPECIGAALEGVAPRVTAEMNTDLFRPFDYDDVGKAVFSMGAIKSPGGDGFPTLF